VTQEVMCHIVVKVLNDVLIEPFVWPTTTSSEAVFLHDDPTPEYMTIMLILHVQVFLVHQSPFGRGPALFASIDSPPKSLSTT
jgi:hypothetical protein